MLITDKKLHSFIYWPVLLAFRLKHTLYSSARNGCLIGSRLNSSPGVKELWLSSFSWMFFIFILSLQLMGSWQKTVLLSMISNLWMSTWRRKHMSRRRGSCTDRRWAEQLRFQAVKMCWLRLLLRLVFISVRRQQEEWSQRDGGCLTQERPHPLYVNTCVWLKHYDPNYSMNATSIFWGIFIFQVNVWEVHDPYAVIGGDKPSKSGESHSPMFLLATTLPAVQQHHLYE